MSMTLPKTGRCTRSAQVILEEALNRAQHIGGEYSDDSLGEGLIEMVGKLERRGVDQEKIAMALGAAFLYGLATGDCGR